MCVGIPRPARVELQSFLHLPPPPATHRSLPRGLLKRDSNGSSGSVNKHHPVEVEKINNSHAVVFPRSNNYQPRMSCVDLCWLQLAGRSQRVPSGLAKQYETPLHMLSDDHPKECSFYLVRPTFLKRCCKTLSSGRNISAVQSSHENSQQRKGEWRVKHPLQYIGYIAKAWRYSPEYRQDLNESASDSPAHPYAPTHTDRQT